ncbi:MAG TPA: hypothetical protein VG097_13490, partial [Gemmata sp.]|nr:hypothetical protein [Gemmata sp.]
MPKILLEYARLRELHRQCLHHDVTPLFLNHCLDGEPPRVFKVLKPLFDECLEQLSIMSFDELSLTVESISQGFRMMVEPVDRLMQPEYLERVAHYYLANELLKSHAPMTGAVSSLPDDSEILSACPELREQFDKDGLLHLSNEMEMFDAGVKYHDYFFYVHQFLRRAFAASPNYDFIGRFAGYLRTTCDTNQFRIALDHRRICRFEDWQLHIECDHWYGPKFDEQRLDDPDYVGLTIVRREYPTSLDQYPLVKT